MGGGVSGLQTALAAARTGVKILLIEQQSSWGGRAQIDEAHIDGLTVNEWVERFRRIECYAQCFT